MPSFSTEVNHALGRERATEMLKDFVLRVRDRYKDQVSQLDGGWNDNVLDFSLTTYGFKITGSLVVEDTKVRLEGNLPFAALAFRGKIEQSIADEIRKELSAS